MRLLAIVEYDGTDFDGFQAQEHRVGPRRTVQSEIERAIAAACGESVRVHGAGRTDAGVHARGQVMHFDTDAPLARDLGQLQLALNAHLPKDLAVHGLQVAPDGFHARFSASSRTYRYLILNAPVRSPLWRRSAHYVRKPLDVEHMQRAAARLIGSHDFVAFAAHEGPHATTRRVLRAQVAVAPARWPDSDLIWHNYIWPAPAAPASGATRAAHVAPVARLVEIEIEANAFLRHMMRRIVGTLVRVGLGSLAEDEVASILVSRDKRRAGPTVPAAGLCLERVTYEPHDLHKGHVQDEDLFA